MTDPSPDGFDYSGTGSTIVNTPYARLRRYAADPQSLSQPPDPGMPKQSAGIANPYGAGIQAFEPNTTPYLAATATEQSDVTKSTVDMPQGNRAPEDAAAKQLADALGKPKAIDYAGGGLVDASGKTQAFLQAALSAAANHIPYVWGGTALNSGVDCSGLIFAAAKAAGIDWKRYVAADYNKMPAVDPAAARPGDILYWAPGQNGVGATGHVAIYLGGGRMVVAPQSGQNVTVSAVFGTPSYHRIFTDNGYAAALLPNGATTYNYNGRPVSVAAPPPTPTSLYTPAVPGSVGRTTRL